MALKVYTPVAEKKVEEGVLASRPVSLEGKVIGFLNNSKNQVDIFLDEVARLMQQQGIAFKAIHYRKLHASHPAPFMDELADQCDVVVNGIGD